MTYYKATRPDGTDFQTGAIDYGAALLSGEVIRHPEAEMVRNDPSTYLSVSVEPADCTGFRWPCRLFRVEPVGWVMENLKASPNKRAVSAIRVVEELPAWQAFGPNGEAVVRFLDRCRTLTAEQGRRVSEGLDAAWDATWDAARDAAWSAAGSAARDAARDAAWDATWSATWYAARGVALDAAGYAARAILVRDKITPEQYAILTKPFVDAGLREWVA